MVEKRSKFAALAEVFQEQQELVEPIHAAEEIEVIPAMPSRPSASMGQGRGRPATGKRSNPDFKMYSHLLKRKTQRAAVIKLMNEDSGRDLSDLLQELLERWVAE